MVSADDDWDHADVEAKPLVGAESKPLVFRIASISARDGDGAHASPRSAAAAAAAGAAAAAAAAGAVQDPVGEQVVRKMNRHVLALLFAVAMCCYIDRTNLAFASVAMTSDLGFNAKVYGLGSGLFFVGYSASMVPSQLALLRVGAPRALAAIVTAWGATAMAFSCLRGERQFYVLRLLLGAFESGAFPAIWYYINSMFPPASITLSYSVIEAAVGAANCLAAPIAAILLMTDGFMGLKGWQILFFVEGLPSVLLGAIIWRSLPRHISDAKFLTPPERSWLTAASAGARKHAEQAEAAGGRLMLLEALSNTRLWAVMGIGLLKNAALTGVLFFAPKLVDAILTGEAVDVAAPGVPTAAAATSVAAAGAGRRVLLGLGVAPPRTAGVRAALLTSVPFVLAAAAAVWIGKRSQERGERCRHLAVPWFAAAALFIAFGSAASHSPEAGFLCLTAAVVCATGPNALLNTLASSVSRGPAQAVSLSLYNAVANLGGLVGPVFIGAVVHRTGYYSSAMQGLGLMLAAAAAAAWSIQRWEH